MTDITRMIGATFTKVEKTRFGIVFHLANGDVFAMYHDQQCCEEVWLDDLNGDLSDLENTPILVAEERTGRYDRYTATFYTFRTVKGAVDVRWNGTSNGYYSERAEVRFLPQDEIQYYDWKWK